MQENNTRLYKRLTVRFILAIFFILVLIFIFPKFIRLLLPFIMAFIVAAIINSLINKVNKKVNIKLDSLLSKKIITLALSFLILLAISSFMYYIFSTIANEVAAFSIDIQENWQEIVTKLNDFQDSFAWVVNILPTQTIDILEGLKESIFIFIQNTSNNLLTSTVSTTATMITRTGSFFIKVFIFFLALYFIISDYNNISDLANKYMGKKFLKFYNLLKNSALAALGGYIKAQFILAFIAFLFMFVSLGIYGQEYALVIALFLGLIDFLPIIGTAIVLLPWGIIEFVSGDINQGIFLIIICIVFFLIRRVIEPKVMGSQTGLHPLLALMSIYVGIQFSGVWGALLGPVVLVLIISVAKSGVFTNTIDDLKELYNKVMTLLAS